MSPLKSNRLAWSVAVASLALWASSAPVTWGQVATGATSLFAQTADDDSNTTTTTLDLQVGDTTITTNDGSCAERAVSDTAPSRRATGASQPGDAGRGHGTAGHVPHLRRRCKHRNRHRPTDRRARF